MLAKTEGAIKITPDKFTYLNPVEFPKLFAPDLPRESLMIVNLSGRGDKDVHTVAEMMKDKTAVN